MSIKNFLKMATGGAMALALSGCGTIWPAGSYPAGLLYTGVQQPHPTQRQEVSGPGKAGDKAGEACSTGILGLVAFGDASTDAAKKAGGITEVHSTEFHGTSILGIYSQGCTEVHGR